MPLCLAILLVLCGHGLPPLPAQTPASDSDSEVTTRLIRQLGDEQFRARETAEAELKKRGRAALPILAKFEGSDDPEIKDRVKRVIRHIKLDPSCVPQDFFVFDSVGTAPPPNPQARWDEVMNPWYEKATISASHTRGPAGTGGPFAQSFVPHAGQIQAVALGCYPANFAVGWVSLEVREDAKGKPSNFVLTRSWVRIEKGCPEPHSSYLVFDIPDVDVKAEQTYWLVFAEYADKGSEHPTITNWGLSTDGSFAEGHLIRGVVGEPSNEEDARFKIISKCTPIPLLRKADENEMKTLPKEAGVAGIVTP